MSNNMSNNKLIIANLQVLWQEAKSSREQKDKFRAAAYQKAIKAIEKCTFDLESGKDAQKLAGVGKKIADKIDEIIETGKLHQVEALGTDQLDKTKTINLFTQVWGVGPAKAKALWDAGARSIRDIEKDHIDLLNDNQKIGLKYFNDLQKRIPREKVDQIVKKINPVIRQIQEELNWNVKSRICGSYRRKADNCGDMDILLCETTGKPILQELVKRLSKAGILKEQLGLGETKYMGITMTTDNTAFRIDMEVIKESEWPFALLYFTGSGPFNERQRTIAKKMGYSLSEHGLKDVETGSFVRGITSERQIFEFLKMDYLAPWDRK